MFDETSFLNLKYEERSCRSNEVFYRVEIEGSSIKKEKSSF